MEGLDPRIIEAFDFLPIYLGQHVILSVSALVLGLGVSLPLALWGARAPRLNWFLLTAASVIQTIPSLALLALFYPFLLALSHLTENLFGTGFSALGFLPSLLALALYSMLPILRNTVTGILGVDPAVKEAAQGVGMTARQSLYQVELPLALPVIMAGIRTAAVWVIGTATLATTVGQTSLGNYIFTGLQTQNWILVLFGCVAAASLALVVDQLLALVERALGKRQRARLVGAALALGALLVGASLAPLARGQDDYVIGAKGFAEQYILASLIEQRLNASGLTASTRSNLGSAVVFNALIGGDVDLYVDYTGTIWTNYMRRSDSGSREFVFDEMRIWLEETENVGVLGALGFENAYALAMRRDLAAELGIRTIDDLALHARALTVGGDLEIFSRPEWSALVEAYGLAFAEQRTMQPTFMYPAIVGGDVDLITAFSSDGRIALHELLVLEDPRQAIPPYDAVLLTSPQRTGDVALSQALAPLIGAITIEAMREANLSVSRDSDQLTSEEAARRLWQNIEAN
ncbi:MAG: ABC transporter permease/substrate-binding protein [Micropepsaceae bacterium]